MRRLALASLLALACTAGVVAPAGAVSSYSFSAAFGANGASELPVTLTLPAPADGSAVTSVTFAWDTSSAPWATGTVQPGSYGGQQVVATPTCVAGAPCTVDATITTGTMSNGADNLRMTVAGTNGYLGTKTSSVSIANAKPSVSVAWPTTSSELAVWGDTTLPVTPAPSADGLPISAVRLYDSASSSAQPIAEADAAPWDLHFDASTVGAQDTKGAFYVMVEDTSGNVARVSKSALVEPPATVGTDVVSGGVAGSTLNQAVDVRLQAAVPDGVDVTTNEQDAGGPVTWAAGIRGFSVSLDGEAPVHLDWNGSWTGTSAPTRDATFDYRLDRVAAGSHELTVTAQTTYGAESTTTTPFLVADGASFGPLMLGAKSITRSTVVPVGRTATVTTTASSGVAGTWLSQPTGVGSLALTAAVPTGLAPDQTSSYALAGTFKPNHPGTWSVGFCVASSGSAACTGGETDPRMVVTHSLVAEYQTRLALTTASTVNRRRVVHATAKDAVLGRALGGLAVQLQRYSGGRWSTVATATSTSRGSLTFSSALTTRSTYRLRTAGISGQDMAATSATKDF